MLWMACSTTSALDIEFDKAVCDQTLPAYIYDGNLEMTCDNGMNSRCTFGSNVQISGMMTYNRLYQHVFNTNNTGYASANLKLLSVEYSLFKMLPFNFCGNWVQLGMYSSHACPYDGSYYFSVPYVLPWDDGDITTWFATGWQGYTDLVIYDSPYEEEASKLASCTLHWKTYVTRSDDDEGWRELPSAVQSTIVLASLLACMCCCCFYLSCCRRRRKHVTDIDYAIDDGGGAPRTDFRILKEKDIEELKKKQKEDLTYKINVNLKEPDWV